MTSGSSPSYVLGDGLLDNSRLSLLSASVLLVEAGFRIVPVTSVPTPESEGGKGTTKHPGSLVGRGWPDKSSVRIEELREWFTPPSDPELAGEPRPGCYRGVPFETMGVGVHVGPDLVVIDIDNPAMVPEWAWPLFDEAPFQSSTPHTEGRGHYVFRKPEGYEFAQGGILPSVEGKPSAGDLRHGNSIFVSAPSPHAKPKGLYQWKRVGEIPVMPGPLAEWVSKKYQRSSFNGHTIVSHAVDEAVVEEFCDEYTAEMVSGIAFQHVGYMVDRANRSSLHTAWLSSLVDLVAMARLGYVVAREAFELSEERFVSLRSDPSRGGLGWEGTVSEPDDAAREHRDLLAWAIGKVEAKAEADLDALTFETYAQVEQFYWRAAPTVEVPETYVEAPTLRGRVVFHPSETEDDLGRKLVENTDFDISDVVKGQALGRYMWCVDTREWMRYNTDKLVWEVSSEEALVFWMSQSLREEYVVVDKLPITKAETRYGASMVSSLAAAFGITANVYAVNESRAKTKRLLDQAISMLKSMPEVSCARADFDASTRLIAVANGNVDVMTGSFVEAKADDMVTRRTAVDYVAGATCPKFLDYVEKALMKGRTGSAARVAREKVEFIQRYFGAALANDWRSAGFLLVYGAAGSGKSTVFYQVPEAVFGNAMGVMEPYTITRSSVGPSRGFAMVDLAGTRYVVCNEAFMSGGRSHVDDTLLKRITSGEPVQVARKSRDVFDARIGRLVFVTNDLPSLSGFDDGVRRRLHAVEFPNGVLSRGGVVDEHLYSRDIEPELPGILAWMIEGARKYRAEGLNAPASVVEESLGVMEASSPVGQFFQHLRPTNEDDKADIASSAVLLRDLHNLYCDWLGANFPNAALTGVTVPSQREFAATVKNRFPTVTMHSRWRFEVNGRRSMGQAVSGLTVNHGWAIHLPPGMATQTGVLSTSKLMIPEVEEWRMRQRSFGRPTAGDPTSLIGDAGRDPWGFAGVSPTDAVESDLGPEDLHTDPLVELADSADGAGPEVIERLPDLPELSLPEVMPEPMLAEEPAEAPEERVPDVVTEEQLPMPSMDPPSFPDLLAGPLDLPVEGLSAAPTEPVDDDEFEPGDDDGPPSTGLAGWLT